MLGTGDLDWTRKASRAAHLAMYRVAAVQRVDVVLEAHFYRGVAEQELGQLGPELVQVWCQCPVLIARTRYRRAARRSNAASRSPPRTSR